MCSARMGWRSIVKDRILRGCCRRASAPHSSKPGNGIAICSDLPLRQVAISLLSDCLCPTTPSAICSGSRPLARATGLRSAAWSTAARRRLALTVEEIQRDLYRRRPGQSRFTTQRQEAGRRHFLSGVMADPETGEQVTTGTPIGLLIENADQRSKDYSDIKDKFRPGHADFTYEANTVCTTIGGAGAPRRARPQCGSRPVLSRARSSPI